MKKPGGASPFALEEGGGGVFLFPNNGQNYIVSFFKDLIFPFSKINKINK